MYRYKSRHHRSVSFDTMRKSLLKTCATVLTHITSKERFIIPSNITPLSEELYQLVDLNYTPCPAKFNPHPITVVHRKKLISIISTCYKFSCESRVKFPLATVDKKRKTGEAIQAWCELAVSPKAKKRPMSFT